jgi:hypothetical protein
MAWHARCRRWLPAPLLTAVLALVGCGTDRTASTSDVGTTAWIQFPEGNPPLLTRALADRLRPGMAQDEALDILRGAARDTPAAKSMIEATDLQGRLNPNRYDLTVAEGKVRLILAFKAKKLAEKKVEGLD